MLSNRNAIPQRHDSKGKTTHGQRIVRIVTTNASSPVTTLVPPVVVAGSRIALVIAEVTPRIAASSPTRPIWVYIRLKLEPLLAYPVTFSRVGAQSRTESLQGTTRSARGHYRKASHAVLVPRSTQRALHTPIHPACHLAKLLLLCWHNLWLCGRRPVHQPVPRRTKHNQCHRSGHYIAEGSHPHRIKGEIDAGREADIYLMICSVASDRFSISVVR